MFCSKCGAQLEDSARFCDKCGNPMNGAPVSQNTVKEKIPDTEVVLRVKPEFNFLYSNIGSIIAAIMVIVMTLLMSFDVGFVAFGTGLFIAGIIMVFAIIGSFFRKAQINNMRYDFYRTKIEYSDSFLNKAEKEVKYKHIRETVLSRGIFERLFGFGSVILYTNAESGLGNGIVISCLKNSEQVYKQIKDLLNND